MSDWTRNPDAVRLLTGKDTPETIYTFTAMDWYNQRQSWIGQGKYQERERIIKLLLEHQPEVGVDSGFVYCSCGISEIWYTEHSIELIKGENK